MEALEKRRERPPAAQPEPATSSPEPSRSGGVSNCYVFKSRLQEYAQKVGIPTPVYQTVKEGPSHVPIFKSTVIVNDVRHDSLPGFFNRKSAEQSAAEIALMEILKSDQMTECIPTLHETGLCKNLLQEYAQKMNYAIPSYVCNKQPSRSNLVACTVEIGGIQYIGAAAKTKKEAEIKAARTALLAIQSSEANKSGASQYTVLPGKRKGKESETQTEVVQHLKPKKVNSKKKWSKKRKFPRNREDLSMKSMKDEGSGKGESASTSPVKDVEMVEESGNENKLRSDDMIDKHLIFADNLTTAVTETNGNFQDRQPEEPNFDCSKQHNKSEVKVENFERSRDGNTVNPVVNGKELETMVAGDFSCRNGEA